MAGIAVMLDRGCIAFSGPPDTLDQDTVLQGYLGVEVRAAPELSPHLPSASTRPPHLGHIQVGRVSRPGASLNGPADPVGASLPTRLDAHEPGSFPLYAGSAANLAGSVALLARQGVKSVAVVANERHLRGFAPSSVRQSRSYVAPAGEPRERRLGRG
jgi:hypothetical protein